MRRISLSTWSLHNALGRPWFNAVLNANWGATKPVAGALSLLDLPSEVARHGIGTLEICHFHLPCTDAAYLSELRSSLKLAGIEGYSLLLDSGDLSQDDPRALDLDLQLSQRWIEVAAELGLGHVRIDLGRLQPTPERIGRSAKALHTLVSCAQSLGVGSIVENWNSMSREPEVLFEIVRQAEVETGLCVDFGNANGPHKTEKLKTLLPRGTSVHAKAEYLEGKLNQAEFEGNLVLMQMCHLRGPVSLIYSQGQNEWTGIEQLKDIVQPYLAA